MAILKKKSKFAAVSRETPENTRNTQPQNTIDPGMAPEYISQVSEEIEGRVAKKLSKEFSRTELRISGASSELDELLLSPQVRTCSVAVPGTSRNNGSKNRKPTGDRPLGDPCPEAVFSTYHSRNLNDSQKKWLITVSKLESEIQQHGTKPYGERIHLYERRKLNSVHIISPIYPPAWEENRSADMPFSNTKWGKSTEKVDGQNQKADSCGELMVFDPIVHSYVESFPSFNAKWQEI